MSKELTIKCPECNHIFSANDALQNHLKSKESEIEKMLKVKEKEISNKAKVEFESKERNLKQKIEAEIKNESNKKIKDLEAKIQSAEKNIKIKENKMQIEFSKKRKDMEDKLKLQEKSLEIEIEKKLKTQFEKSAQAKNSKEIEKLKTELLRKDNEMLKKDKQMQIENQRQEKRINEMAKQIKQTSVEVQGEIQEELIQDFLRKKFPDDDVEEIKKGFKGGDCIQTINYKGQNNLAQIYFESKDHKTFKEEWVAKLLGDMKEKNINYGVLITTTMPKDSDKHTGYALRHGKRIMIIPMNYQIIHLLVDFLRRNLIREFNSKKDFDAPKEMQKLWNHITGPSFQLPMRKLFHSIGSMGDIIDKEKKFYETNMAKKEKALSDMEGEFRDVINSFTSKVGTVLPDNLLE